MKKTLKAASLALVLTVLSPNMIYAAPPPRAEWRDLADNPIARMVKAVRKFIVHVMAEPQSPPPSEQTNP